MLPPIRSLPLALHGLILSFRSRACFCNLDLDQCFSRAVACSWKVVSDPKYKSRPQQEQFNPGPNLFKK